MKRRRGPVIIFSQPYRECECGMKTCFIITMHVNVGLYQKARISIFSWIDFKIYPKFPYETNFLINFHIKQTKMNDAAAILDKHYGASLTGCKDLYIFIIILCITNLYNYLENTVYIAGLHFISILCKVYRLHVPIGLCRLKKRWILYL